MKDEKTSKSVARKAAQILRDPNASPEAKSVAASALTQAADRPIRYEVLKGLNYNDARREPGETVSDLPEDSIAWLIEQEAVRQVESESE